MEEIKDLEKSIKQLEKDISGHGKRKEKILKEYAKVNGYEIGDIFVNMPDLEKDIKAGKGNFGLCTIKKAKKMVDKIGILQEKYFDEINSNYVVKARLKELKTKLKELKKNSNK